MQLAHDCLERSQALLLHKSTLCYKWELDKISAFPHIYNKNFKSWGFSLWNIPVCLRPCKFSLSCMKIFSWCTAPSDIVRNSFYSKLLQIWWWLVYLPGCPHDQYRPCFHYQLIRQKAGKAGQHLTCTCRFGPTLLCLLLFSSHRPVYRMADDPNTFLGSADTRACGHLHFQLLLSHLLSCIWTPWRQSVAGSAFTSLSSHPSVLICSSTAPLVSAGIGSRNDQALL